MVRKYSRVAGVGLLLLGAVGLVGLLDFFQPLSDYIHLGTGALLVYVGFGNRSDGPVRGVVGGVGVLYVVIGILVPTFVLLSSMPLSLYHNGEDVLHVAFGQISLFIAISPPGTSQPPTLA
jgi:hypothetical protein